MALRHEPRARATDGEWSSEELQSVLRTSGIDSRIKGDEVAIEVCPGCGNEKWNVEMNAAKAVWHCWACKAGGRLSALLKTLTGQEYRITASAARGNKPTKAAPLTTPAEFQFLSITAVPSAKQYLDARGVTADVAATYGLQVCSEKGHMLEGRIVIPAREYWTSAVVGWIGRSYTGKRPKYMSTLPRKVITGWRVRDQAAPAVMVEGPMDGIAAHRAGFNAAVLSGMGGAGVLEWASRVSPRAPIAILLDAEAIEQARRLYWEVGQVRPGSVALVGLPAGEDPASIGPAAVRDAVRQAISQLAPTT